MPPPSEISNLKSQPHPTLGIFAKTFPRPTLQSVLDAVSDNGFSTIQFNFSCAGLPSMPDTIDPILVQHINDTMASRNLHMAAVSGTFNMIHPNPAQREDGLKRLQQIISCSPQMGTNMVTLCTGTRDPDNMWRRHPDNDQNDAWKDLCRSLDQALSMAADHGVILGVEPETGNVMSNAAKARQLLDELQSPHLKIILDPANLIGPETLTQQRDLIQNAIEVLGDNLAIAHAKELGPDGQPDETLPLGQGCLEWDVYLGQLQQAQFTGPLIMHGCLEDAVPESRRFLQEHDSGNTP